jgi:hypothetical protein
MLMNNQKKLIPGKNNIRKFRTEEELIDYYEMKAIDPYANNQPQDHDEDADEDDILKNTLDKQLSKEKRRRADSLKKNIKKYEKMYKNRNDSRDKDFEGFDEEIDES